MSSGFLKGYRAFWVYTLARFALFAVLFLLLWAVGVPFIFAGLIAVVVSVPLSWFLLAKPRQAFAATIEERVDSRRERARDLEARLEGGDGVSGDGDDVTRGRAKRR